MTDANGYQSIPLLITGDDGPSVWVEHSWPPQTRGGMLLTPRIETGSMRLRTSEPGYAADWHVAGEAVLIVVRRGVLRIVLRDGEARDFAAGDVFIAGDVLPTGETFDPEVHGHRAQVIGNERLEAVHIKLVDFQR